MIVFSDANPQHGYAAAQVGVGGSPGRGRPRRLRPTGAHERSRLLLDRRRAAHRNRQDPARRRRGSNSPPAHGPDVGRLYQYLEGLPVIAIVADTTPAVLAEYPFYLEFNARRWMAWAEPSHWRCLNTNRKSGPQRTRRQHNKPALAATSLLQRKGAPGTNGKRLRK